MGKLFDALIGWSIRQRAVVLMVAAALVALGLRTLASARTDVLPELTPPRVVVQTDVPGMATLDVEELVTRPLERVLLGTAEMTAVRSSSTPGLSVVTVHFADGVDVPVLLLRRALRWSILRRRGSAIHGTHRGVVVGTGHHGRFGRGGHDRRRRAGILDDWRRRAINAGG